MGSHLLAAGSGGSAIQGFVLILAGIAAYWVPAFVAWRRNVRSRGSVVVINAFLGWTVIGWVVALAMACRSVDRPADGWETAQPVSRVRGQGQG